VSTQAQGLLCQYLSEDMSGINLGSLELPKIENDLIKMKISHASLNFPDWLMSQGKYQRKPELPFFLGMEGSGIIESVGPNVKDLKINDEVMFGGWGHGAMANYIVLPESKISKKPNALNMAEAAAFATAYTTAYVSLIRRGEMNPDDVVLIHGSSGGVGMDKYDIIRVHLASPN
jgi:NADPH2:quinone reductase